jgi:hypothetical protein
MGVIEDLPDSCPHILSGRRFLGFEQFRRCCVEEIRFHEVPANRNSKSPQIMPFASSPRAKRGLQLEFNPGRRMSNARRGVEGVGIEKRWFPLARLDSHDLLATHRRQSIGFDRREVENDPSRIAPDSSGMDCQKYGASSSVNAPTYVASVLSVRNSRIVFPS